MIHPQPQRSHILILGIALALWSGPLDAQSSFNPDDILPPDPQITIGSFENGLKYYIRHNARPEKRLELRLVIKAGSVLEDDDQQGLAHFVEHMAFNGTKNFPKMDLVNFLERMGVRFGPDLNAYTSFDETVYMLQVPTDSIHLVEKAFDILEDWAHNISFDDTEIDKERGVVGEEWRLGRGAFERVNNKHNPVIFHNSQYAKRLPIGKKEIIDTAPYDKLKQFYRDWYRPELMAVVAVGDYDSKKLETLIREHFSKLTNPPKPRPRTNYTLPHHDETLVSVATDKELPVTQVQVLFKRPEDKQETVSDYRRYILDALYDGMLNIRLNERLQKPDPPFVYGGVGNFNFVGGTQAYALFINAKEDGIVAGTRSILQEAYRVHMHGFTRTELERQKAQMMSGIEQSYRERDKTESSRHAGEYIRNFLDDELIPGIAVEYELYKALLPSIDLREINALSNVRIRQGDRIVTVSAPDKPGVIAPKEVDMKKLLDEVAGSKLEAYVDEVGGETLIKTPPTPGSVTAKKQIEGLDAEEWTLSNGARVVVKTTDFKNDEILFGAWSPGGNSLVKDEDFMSAANVGQVIGSSGVGSFDAVTLQKMLAGKVVRVSPSVSGLSEGFSGSTTPKDLETLFQLTYLYFTQPRLDEPAVGAFMERFKAFLQNFKASPEAAFQDTVAVTLSNYHHRGRPMEPALLDEVRPERSYEFFKDRFADAGDFVFFFVGSLKIEELEPLVRQYLASLPATGRKESWKDVGMRTPEGVISKSLKKGIEAKSMVHLSLGGPFPWNIEERFAFSAMLEVLDIKLREVLREDRGGVYGVQVNGSPSKYPREEYTITIGFGCAPERVEELITAVHQQTDSLASVPVTADYVAKVKELMRREREVNLRENGWWLSAFRVSYANNEDPRSILTFDNRVEAISADMILKAGKKYLPRKNYVRVVLYPETPLREP